MEYQHNHVLAQYVLLDVKEYIVRSSLLNYRIP